MNKCLRIIIFAEFPVGFLQSFVQKNARKFNLEGVAQMLSEPNQARVVVCGPKESVDSFLDSLHKGSAKWKPEDIEMEPFLKDKDYRGVFRVIE